MNKYNRLFSFLLQLKHMVWSLSDVWFHLKRTGELLLLQGIGQSASHGLKEHFPRQSPKSLLTWSSLPMEVEVQSINRYALCIYLFD